MQAKAAPRAPGFCNACGSAACTEIPRCRHGRRVVAHRRECRHKSGTRRRRRRSLGGLEIQAWGPLSVRIAAMGGGRMGLPGTPRPPGVRWRPNRVSAQRPDRLAGRRGGCLPLGECCQRKWVLRGHTCPERSAAGCQSEGKQRLGDNPFITEYTAAEGLADAADDREPFPLSDSLSTCSDAHHCRAGELSYWS
jgi:hypothetical protein